MTPPVVLGPESASDAAGLAAEADERKYLSILFVDIQQSTALVADLEPEEALDLLEPALEIMRDAVRRHGGIVSKELGDGIMALFGAPISNAWHAVMACQAAMAIAETVARRGDPRIQVRAGIHSHYVVTRRIRGDLSSVYDASGPAAHLANRLEAAAGPGEALVSGSCRALCVGLVEFAALGSLDLKGFAQPVAAYRVISARPQSLWQARSARSFTPFAGRSSEIATLRRAAEMAGTAAARIVSVIADPGVGKSRLVNEFSNGLRRDGWTVVEVACLPSRSAAPYAAIEEILTQLHPGLRSRDSDLAAAVGWAPGETTADRVSALRIILNRPVTDPNWRGLTPAEQSRVIGETFCGIVEQFAAASPLVVIVDDVHWLDAPSAAALAWLAPIARRCRLLPILTSRPYDPVVQFDADSVTTIALRPLSDAAGTEVLDAVLGTAPALDRLKQRVLRHTGGVPLFIEEVIRHLTDGGVLVGDIGSLSLPEACDELGVPVTIRGAIAERIDRLGRTQKSMLQLAAVVGSGIVVRLLAAIAGADETAVAAELAALGSAGVMVETGSGGAQAFEFVHDLIREVTYDSLLLREREALHARILHHLEAAANPEAAELLCHHAHRARQWEKVAGYAHQAARSCLARSALPDSARYFELAVEALDRSPRSLEREERAIDLRLESRLALPSVGQFGKWMDYATDAAARALAIDDSSRQVAAVVEQAAAANFYCDPPEAVRLGDIAVQRVRQFNSPGWLSRAEFALAQAYLTGGRYRGSAQYFGQAYERLAGDSAGAADGANVPRTMVLCCMMKSVAHAAMGEYVPAELWQDRANALAAASGRPYEQIAASYSRGFFHLQWSRFDQARVALTGAEELAGRYGVRQFMPIITCQLGKLYLQTGRLAEAQDILARTQREARKVGHMLSEWRAAVYLAHAVGGQGDSASALAIAREARDAALRSGLDGVRVEALVAEATLLLGALPLATVELRTCLAEAISLANAIEARPQLAGAKIVLASLLDRCHDRAGARQEWDAAAQLFREMQMTPQSAGLVALDDRNFG